MQLNLAGWARPGGAVVEVLVRPTGMSQTLEPEFTTTTSKESEHFNV